jgi:hypothetical protein
MSFLCCSKLNGENSETNDEGQMENVSISTVHMPIDDMQQSKKASKNSKRVTVIEV